MDIIRSGRIDVKSLISHSIGLEELSEALSDPERRTKGIVTIDPGN